jgi:hypothetical protein
MSNHCKTLILKLSRHYCDEDDDDSNRNERKMKIYVSFKIASGTQSHGQTRRKDFLTWGRIDGMRHHRNVMHFFVLLYSSADYYNLKRPRRI